MKRIVSVLVVLLLLVGCGSGFSNPQDLLKKVTEVSKTDKSVQADVSLVLDVKSGEQKASMEISGTIGINLETSEAKVELVAKQEFMGTKTETPMVTYLVQDAAGQYWAYTKDMESWTKEKQESNPFTAFTSTSQDETFKDGKLTTEEDSYTITKLITLADLQKIANETKTENSGVDLNTLIQMSGLNTDSKEGFNATLKVNKSDTRISSFSMEFKEILTELAKMLFSSLSEGEEVETVVNAANLTISNIKYNELGAIELPAEANDAKDVADSMGNIELNVNDNVQMACGLLVDEKKSTISVLKEYAGLTESQKILVDGKEEDGSYLVTDCTKLTVSE